MTMALLILTQQELDVIYLILVVNKQWIASSLLFCIEFDSSFSSFLALVSLDSCFFPLKAMEIRYL